MPKFDVGTVVESLDYDFTAITKGVKGTIPEASDDRIGKFLGDLRDLMKEASKLAGDGSEDEDEGDPGVILARLNDLDPDQFVVILKKMSATYAELCQDKPSEAHIQALPLRVRRKFFEWVTREMVSPEAEPAGTSAQVIHLPAAAGGSSTT
jgi:hypothetical protein